MRLLVLLVAVLLVALAAALLVRAFRGVPGGNSDALEATARWEAHTSSADGVTTVVVRKVAETPQGLIEFGRQSIASIPDDDPQWDIRYHEAMAEARSRVAALQIEAD